MSPSADTVTHSALNIIFCHSVVQSQFVVYSSDRKVRVFRHATGKLRCTIDETLDAAQEVQRAGAEARRQYRLFVLRRAS